MLDKFEIVGIQEKNYEVKKYKHFACGSLICEQPFKSKAEKRVNDGGCRIEALKLFT